MCVCTHLVKPAHASTKGVNVISRRCTNMPRVVWVRRMGEVGVWVCVGVVWVCVVPVVGVAAAGVGWCVCV
jgi:hypothetical protein